MSVQPGDVYSANLDPSRGTEQHGVRPVIVISVVPLGPRAIVVPMTTTLRGWATRIRLNVHGIESEAMCEQVRAIDVDHLHEDLDGRLAPEAVREIQRTVARLIGVY